MAGFLRETLIHGDIVILNLKMLMVLVVFGLTGCANLVSGLTAKMADDLAYTILNSDDLDTVREGVPAYLLLIDSFLRSSPENENLLLAASSLNGSFSIFADEERAMLLTAKSLSYALKAACIRSERLCNFRSLGFQEFQAVVDKMGLADVRVAYAIGVAWAGWIQANSDDWNAIAELGKVRYLMERVIILDETWENGGSHLYMGVLETILPAVAGGHPEKGRAHFEKALTLSEEKYLMTKVIYAEKYARLVFDKEIHDRLLTEVMSANPVVEGMTLTNRLAQERAKELLASSHEYF
ncbi:MAG: TRAP transporter TatT component family protein [Gammaproteobacteria bacterium]|nr:TRAP transporter TatT component family protein [Gammaproteobacteria bacterium]